ncbi:hypothetical protein A2U01_0000306 [Trifolium medium]|uniref:Endonuclease/exonuclease/phosphatase family protein n=1 Tax=Trifolium medium TaxID=97028 RepID=A0A392LXF6_9FABA|nr:hypothetical protein [Trifolium medium]
MQNLKKVARLPRQDHKEVLKILKKEVRKRSGRMENKNSVKSVHPSSSNSNSSTASVNKDWEHWVVMHGNEKVAEEDVREVGQTIGVRFSGADSNMFKVLAGEGRGKGERR